MLSHQLRVTDKVKWMRMLMNTKREEAYKNQKSQLWWRKKKVFEFPTISEASELSWERKVFASHHFVIKYSEKKKNFHLFLGIFIIVLAALFFASKLMMWLVSYEEGKKRIQNSEFQLCKSKVSFRWLKESFINSSKIACDKSSLSTIKKRRRIRVQ